MQLNASHFSDWCSYCMHIVLCIHAGKHSYILHNMLINLCCFLFPVLPLPTESFSTFPTHSSGSVCKDFSPMYHLEIQSKTKVSICTFVVRFPLITFEGENTQLIDLIDLLLQTNLKEEVYDMFKGSFCLMFSCGQNQNKVFSQMRNRIVNSIMGLRMLLFKLMAVCYGILWKIIITNKQ